MTEVMTTDHHAEIKTCIDRELPFLPAAAADFAPPTPNPELPAAFAIVIAKKWPNNSILDVYFMDGDPIVQERVKRIANQWSEYANIRFRWVDDPRAVIRISFAQQGSWSYIGQDARRISQSQPTMNFGWLRPNSADTEYERVVLHEFGHALGLIHEHQNPAGGIPWNREAVYEYYAGPPNNWSKATTDTDLFQTYDKNQVNFSGFDPESIMLYPIPNAFTIGDFEVGWNTDLSDTDRMWISQAYPKSTGDLSIDAAPRSESIGEPGQEDLFQFQVHEPGRYRVETSGHADLVMSLFGPEDDTKLIAQDDDSGRRLNPRIASDLAWGRYTVRVRHFSASRTGDYEIFVVKEGSA